MNLQMCTRRHRRAGRIVPAYRAGVSCVRPYIERGLLAAYWRSETCQIRHGAVVGLETTDVVKPTCGLKTAGTRVWVLLLRATA